MANAISLADALTFFHRGNALFVDARSSSDYAKGHIAGALSLPVTTDALSPEQSFRLSQAPNVVVYCNRNCIDARIVARLLFRAGADSVNIYSAGWDEWVTLKQPVE